MSTHGRLPRGVGDCDCQWWVVRLLWLLLPHIFHIFCLHRRRSEPGRKNKKEQEQEHEPEAAWQQRTAHHGQREDGGGRQRGWTVVYLANNNSNSNNGTQPDRRQPDRGTKRTDRRTNGQEWEMEAYALMPGILSNLILAARHTACAPCPMPATCHMSRHRPRCGRCTN